jgi:hypothetical protein
MSEDVVSSDDSIDKGRYLMIMILMMIELMMMMMDDDYMMIMIMSMLSINHNSYYVNTTFYRMDF